MKVSRFPNSQLAIIEKVKELKNFFLQNINLWRTRFIWKDIFFSILLHTEVCAKPKTYLARLCTMTICFMEFNHVYCLHPFAPTCTWLTLIKIVRFASHIKIIKWSFRISRNCQWLWTIYQVSNTRNRNTLSGWLKIFEFKLATILNVVFMLILKWLFKVKWLNLLNFI